MYEEQREERGNNLLGGVVLGAGLAGAGLLGRSLYKNRARRAPIASNQPNVTGDVSGKSGVGFRDNPPAQNPRRSYENQRPNT